MTLLVFDFDGVISDSAPESFEVALRTFRHLGDPRALSAWPREDLYRRFLAIMPLGNRSEDFGIALCAIDGAVPLEHQEAYQAFRATLDPAWLDEFHRVFYETRHHFAQEDGERWRALLGPYPAFVELLRRRAGIHPYAIATAKDRASVDLLLADYGIADLFPDALILDKETGVSKVAHHERLAERTGCPYHEMTFVDDKVNHLDHVASLGVRGVLAAWGYNGPREHEAARARGYEVATLEDAERCLFGRARPKLDPT